MSFEIQRFCKNNPTPIYRKNKSQIKNRLWDAYVWELFKNIKGFKNKNFARICFITFLLNCFRFIYRGYYFFNEEVIFIGINFLRYTRIQFNE